MVQAAAMSLAEFEEAKTEILRLFSIDEPLLAENELKKLGKLTISNFDPSYHIGARVKNDQPQNPELIALFDEFEKTEQMQLLMKDVVILQQFREEIRAIADGSDQSWTRHKDTPDVKIFYKIEDGFRNCTLYMEKVINAPLINVLAVLAEAQLFN